MNVGQLIEEIEHYLNNNDGVYYNNMYVSDEDTMDGFTIDSVYYRCGEVVLQSNETDTGDWSLILPYILHCLRFFNRNLEVCVQYSDEDLDWMYYSTDYTYVDDDGDFHIWCYER